MRLQQIARDLWPYLQELAQETNRSIVAGGGSYVSGGGAPSPHALNSGHHTGILDDGQAPQFLKTDGSRTLTDNLPVAAGKTIDGVDISAHAANPAAHHDPVTAGDTSLTLVDQAAVVNLATNSGLTVSSGLKLGTPSTVTLGGTNAVGGSNHSHAISTSNDVGTVPAAAILASGSSGDLVLAELTLKSDLIFAGSDGYITSGAGIDVTWNLGGDLILNSAKTWRSSDYADGIPIVGFSSHINSGGFRQLTINTIKTDEFHTRLFVADGVRIDIGEEYWGKSRGIVHTDWTTPSSIGGSVVVYFEDSAILTGALFQDADWILIRFLDNSAGFAFGSIWGQVYGYTDEGADAEGRGHQSWTFTLRSGTTNQLVKKGNVAVDFGSSGQGYIHLSTLIDADGPWIQIGEWNGANPYTPGNRTIGTQIGLLDSISDATLNPVGYGLYSVNAYLSGILSVASDVVRLDDTGARIKGQPTDYDSQYAYEFQNGSGVEVGGVYLKYTDLATDYAETSLRSIGSTGVRPLTTVLAYSDETGVAGSPFILIQAYSSTGPTFANITMDVTPTTGTMILSATDFVQVNSDFQTLDVLPQADDTYDLGSASLRFATLYVTQIIADTISGGVIGGAEWEYPGSVVIDANNTSNTTVSVTNQGTGRADLDVDRNITLGGTIDGVDLAAHVLNASAHHAPASGAGAINVSSQVVSLTLGATSGLDQTSGLVIASSIAGDGLSLTSGVLDVDATVVRTTRAINTGSGLSGGGNLSADLTVSVDATVVRTTRVITSGAGLTGGGDLSADRTLAVGQGDGITVAADTVSVDATVVRTGRNLTAGNGLTGGGDLSADRTFAVGSGFGMLITADAIAVDQGMIPTWTGAHTFNSDPQLAADLDFIGASRQITTASTYDLTITPGGSLNLSPSGDVIVNPTGSDMLPGSSISIDLGDYNRKWRTLYAAELYVEALVAQQVLATIGGRVMVTGTTALVSDISAGTTTITVKHNGVLSVNMYVLLEGLKTSYQFEVMKVTASLGAGGGGYQYTVTRGSGGTAAAWYAGDAVASLAAAAGQGWIELAASSTAFGDIGPTMTVYSRTATTTWNSVKPVVTLGNLDSFVDYASTEFGQAGGNDLTLTPSGGFSGYTIDRTNGLRLFNTSLNLYVSGSIAASLTASGGLKFARGAFGSSYGGLSWYTSLPSGSELYSVEIRSSPFDVLSFQGNNTDMLLLDKENHWIEVPYDTLNVTSGLLQVNNINRAQIKLTNAPYGIGGIWDLNTATGAYKSSGASDGDLVVGRSDSSYVRARFPLSGSDAFILNDGNLAVSAGDINASGAGDFGSNLTAAGNIFASSGGIGTSAHGTSSDRRAMTWFFQGYYVDSTHINVIAFDMMTSRGATVMVTYSQHNTDYSPDELYMGLGVLTINYNGSTFPTNTVSYVGTNKLGLSVSTSGARVMVQLVRTSSGATFRNTATYRHLTVTLMGYHSNVQIGPSSI